MTIRGQSLHIGLNRLDPAAYDGWQGALASCENDAKDMAAIATAQGFTAKVLLTSDARGDAVLYAVGSAAAALRDGDMFLLTFAGHGAQQRVVDDPTEDDGCDEYIALYDRMLRDDDIGAALAAFAPGVRVVTFFDCCHSGTEIRDVPTRADTVQLREVPPSVVAAVLATHPHTYARLVAPDPAASTVADALELSACQDKEQAFGDDRNGFFTAAVTEVWADGSFTGDYVALHDQVTKRLAPRQNPNLMAQGPVATRTAHDRPFILTTTPVGRDVVATADPTNNDKEHAMTATTTLDETYVSGDANDNWADVEQALRARGLADGSSDTLVPVAPRGVRLAPNGSVARGGDVTVRVFWWGFHLQIGHATLEEVLNDVDSVAGLVGAVGGAIPRPAQPWIALAAKFVAGAHALLRSVDKGNGIYLSMSWIAPGVFVPTTVPAGRDVIVESRGEPIQEPQDFWINESDRDVDTGLYIRNGQRIVFSATGEIWAGVFLTGRNGPQGWAGWSASGDSPLPGAAPFSLLARLDGRYLTVGTGREVIYRGPGSKLFLRINDDVPGNGNGQFQVHIEVYAS